MGSVLVEWVVRIHHPGTTGKKKHFQIIDQSRAAIGMLDRRTGMPQLSDHCIVANRRGFFSLRFPNGLHRFVIKVSIRAASGTDRPVGADDPTKPLIRALIAFKNPM